MSNDSTVRIWQDEVVIPTYPVGQPNRNPMFLEKRVYQGSSGRVYPYPVIDRICDDPVAETHRVVFLENQYLKLMVMPGFGGRIQYAYDKTNDYPFIYHNRVIKPALVGLAGPWLSGGIEFNWPQHHRPGTYCPVDFTITDNPDGSMTLWLSELEPMWHLKGTLGLTLYPNRALLEIQIRLFNPTALPQSFHLWTNPAVHVNDHYQSVFPPDVQAVYDHGKRDVSAFPIARGEYYKVDYSRGVDISWYKNLPVPTSYMAAKSDYDFVGGYDHEKQAGVLHIADHHVIPGKKQWVWGCGDFGKAWDRNLTDADGPYAELMCGVFADNQPDFSWLEPFEQKEVKQFFLPYKRIGYVRNATVEAAVSFELKNGRAQVGAYVTSPRHRAEIKLSHGGKVIWSKRADLNPQSPFTAEITLSKRVRAEELELCVCDQQGRTLVSYRPEPKQAETIPEPAAAIAEPRKLPSTESLFLAGLHLEQYRHATREPEEYYREALRRDPFDVRNNNALGLLLVRRGQFAQAEPFFHAAIKTQTRHNPNPKDGEPYYNLGVCLRYLGRLDQAYDAFFKATWNAGWQAAAYFQLGQLTAIRGDFQQALELVDSSLARNRENQKATHLHTLLLRKLGRTDEALSVAKTALGADPLDFGARNELVLLGVASEREKLDALMRQNAESYLSIAGDYASAGAYKDAVGLLERFIELDRPESDSPRRAPGHLGDAGNPNLRPMVFYSLGHYAIRDGNKRAAAQYFKQGRQQIPDRCFPNSLDSLVVLKTVLECNPRDARASLYLGNLWYDKRQVDDATACWERARRCEPTLPTVHRNLALVYFNKQKDPAKAIRAMQRAFELDQTDARVLFELDLLKKRTGIAADKRLKFLRRHRALVAEREDLLIEFVTLLNFFGLHQEALQLLTNRKFHPWEGGEGKVTGQYVVSLVELAKTLLGVAGPLNIDSKQNAQPAIELLERARTYPENLGEGKLHGAQENHILFWLGVAHEKAGDLAAAKRFWKEASTGMQSPTPAVYYNDQNPETIFYQGLSLQKLGRKAEAMKRFQTLVNFGRKHLRDPIEIDYFAVSLPEFMVFDDDLNKRNELNCRYLIGLGLVGLGKPAGGLREFKNVLKLDPAHLSAQLHLNAASWTARATSTQQFRSQHSVHDHTA
jgi:tetratricopeptide (TPR) repeat protein